MREVNDQRLRGVFVFREINVIFIDNCLLLCARHQNQNFSLNCEILIEGYWHVSQINCLKGWFLRFLAHFCCFIKEKCAIVWILMSVCLSFIKINTEMRFCLFRSQKAPTFIFLWLKNDVGVNPQQKCLIKICIIYKQAKKTSQIGKKSDKNGILLTV